MPNKKGIQVPEEILPTLGGKTLGQLASTLRTCGNRLEKLLQETVAGVLNLLGTIKSSGQNGGSVFAEMYGLLDDTVAELADAVKPLQRLLPPPDETPKESRWTQDDVKETMRLNELSGHIVSEAFSMVLERNPEEANRLNRLLEKNRLAPEVLLNATLLNEEFENHIESICSLLPIHSGRKTDISSMQDLLEDLQVAIINEIDQASAVTKTMNA